MLLLYVLIFLLSCAVLTFASKLLVDVVSRISLFLKMKEFVVAFFLMAVAVSLPNLFVGIISALKGIPELSFGDIVSGNIIDLSIGIGIPALISRAGLTADSRTLQGSVFFVITIATLPLLLVLDGELSRIDGILLISSFIFYLAWTFSKKERFTKVYDHSTEKLNLKKFLKDIILLLVGVALLLLAAKGIVTAAMFFYQFFDLPLALIGIFVVGLGTALPETFFSIQAARKGQDWALLGDLMGGITITASLVLGIVVLIAPIVITDFSPFLVARIFLIISALSFLILIRTGHKITKAEGLYSISLYLLFITVEILTRFFK